MESRGEEAEAWLKCDGCGRRYPVRKGIPRFVSPVGTAPHDEVAAQFLTEFTELSHGDRDIDPLLLREYYFFSRTGFDPQLYEALPGDPYRTSLPEDAYRPDGRVLKGKTVLDAGCGPARFTEVAALHGPRLVIGLDLGDHIERAAERCAHLPNTAFVQGSVLDPPFKREVFDTVFSIGVLHHTGDPRGGTRALSTLVAPGGFMALWLYPNEYWGRGPQRPIGRFIHKMVSKRNPQAALQFCQRWLYPIGKIQMAVHRQRFLRYLLAPLFVIKVPRHPVPEVMLATIFDYYSPIFISTHGSKEVSGWLTAEGFTGLKVLPVPTSVIGTKRVGRA